MMRILKKNMYDVPTGHSLHFFLLHIFLKLHRISIINGGYYLYFIYYNRYIIFFCLLWIPVLIINVDTLKEKKHEKTFEWNTIVFMFTRTVTYSKSKLHIIVMDDVQVYMLGFVYYTLVLLLSHKKKWIDTPIIHCQAETGRKG